MSTALGERIRKLRKEKGYSLDRLADETGSSKSYIWTLENKNPPRPSAEKLAKIAEVLGTTLEYLVDQVGAITEEDAVDAQFYRRYRRMPEATKAKIRSTLDIWAQEDD
ncbi:MAG: helix-turn-helix transcriptional regulator [Pseudomonadota bacterium]